jgi:hypothetical protein
MPRSPDEEPGGPRAPGGGRAADHRLGLHGAPTANLISGGLPALALPALAWLLVLRIRRRRWRQAREFVDDLTA